MKILYLAAGPELVASSRTRVYQYLPHLRKYGIEARIVNYIGLSRCKSNLSLAPSSFFKKILDKIFSWFQILKVMILARSHDILFIQKVLLPKFLLDLLKDENDNIVFDFDDAIYLADRFTTDSKSGLFLKRFDHTLEVSKHIIVENEQNETYAKRFNPNVARITGPIDTSRYVPRPVASSRSGKVVVGWIGSPEATKYLAPLAGVFRRLSEKHNNMALLLIGASDFKAQGVDVSIRAWSFEDERKDLHSFDIGIMPLEDDEWSRGKGGYKLLQYMAVGTPCVASPVGVNRDIIKEGSNGYLAKTEEEWFNALSRLVADENLRRAMGRTGRSMAEAVYSYEAQTPKMMAIFNNILGAKNAL